MPGCGKSTIGKLLSEKLGLDFCDVDEYIENKEGLTIPQIFRYGESYFRKVEEISVAEISKTFPKVISTGGGVVLNSKNIDNLKENGIIIFIERPLEKIISDLDISGRPLLKEGIEKIYSLYKERIELYKKYCDIEVVNDRKIEDTIESIIKELEGVRL